MDEEKHPDGATCGGDRETCEAMKRLLAYDFSEKDLAHLEAK